MSAARRQELRDKIGALQTEVEKCNGQVQAWKDRAQKLYLEKQTLKGELRKLELEPDPVPEREEITITSDDIGELKV